MSNIIVIFIFSSILYQTRAKICPLVEYKLTNWSRIVPDGLHELPNDLEMCRVIYPSGAEVTMGNYLTQSEAYEAPSTIIWTADPLSYYYLILEDIDVPTRQAPTMRATFHWMIGNIPGNNVTAGETIFPYFPPQGSHSSGLHRFVFLVYKQSKKNDYMLFKAKRTVSRGNFDVRELSSRFHSQGPVAVNFFHYRVYPIDSSHVFK